LDSEQEVQFSVHEARMISFRLLLATALVIAGMPFGVANEQPDADAAQSLAKKSKCTTCHSVDKKKDGPSYKSIAAKYKGQADAANKLFTHLTSNPKIKVDGKDETHEAPKTKNEADIKNLVAWILSL
jgi:cytochrome c